MYMPTCRGMTIGRYRGLLVELRNLYIFATNNTVFVNANAENVHEFLLTLGHLSSSADQHLQGYLLYKHSRRGPGRLQSVCFYATDRRA